MTDRPPQDLEALSFDSRVHEAPCNISPQEAATMVDSGHRICQTAGMQAYIERAGNCNKDPVAAVETLEPLLHTDETGRREAASKVLTAVLAEDTEIVLRHLDTVWFLAQCDTAAGTDAARALSETLRWNPEFPLAIDGLIELIQHRDDRVARASGGGLAGGLIAQEAGVSESRDTPLPVDIPPSQPHAQRLLVEAVAQIAKDESAAQRVVRRDLSDAEIRSVRITAANVLAATYISDREAGDTLLFTDRKRFSRKSPYSISLEALAATFRAYPRDSDRIHDLNKALEWEPMIAVAGLAGLVGEGILSARYVRGAVHRPAFDHDRPEIRQFASRHVYWRWQSPYGGYGIGYIEPLCELLKDPAVQVRRAAAKTLIQFLSARRTETAQQIREYTTSGRPYLSLLTEDDDDLRSSAIEICTHMILDNPAEVVWLKPLLRGDSPRNTRTALEVAASVAQTDTAPIVQIWETLLPQLEEQNTEVLVQFRQLVTEVLLKGATDATHLQRLLAGTGANECAKEEQ